MAEVNIVFLCLACCTIGFLYGYKAGLERASN
jgi:hypothetical protein